MYLHRATNFRYVLMEGYISGNRGPLIAEQIKPGPLSAPECWLNMGVPCALILRPAHSLGVQWTLELFRYQGFSPVLSNTFHCSNTEALAEQMVMKPRMYNFLPLMVHNRSSRNK